MKITDRVQKTNTASSVRCGEVFYYADQAYLRINNDYRNAKNGEIGAVSLGGNFDATFFSEACQVDIRRNVEITLS